ncbi:T9SS type A sorting domain-containing protein [Psychroflexus planctonicus]|nr:T9SS type A sorting domain-containing protein [Psychroflexus planctonicus]
MKKLLLILLCFTFGFTQAQEIGIVGPAADGWPSDENPTDIMLTNNGDGTYSIDALTLSTGPAKFREDQAWDVSYGGDNFPSGSITGGDIPVQAGVYDIVLDLNNDTYTFTDVGTFEEISVTGSALSEAIDLSTADGENYEASVNQFVDGTVTFESSNGDVYGSDDFPSGTLVLNGNPIAVTAGYYEVEFNLTTLDFSFNIPDVGLVGPGVSEWPGDNPTPDVLMTSTDGNIYTLSSQEFFDDEVKFRQNQSWNTNWGGTGFPSGDLVFNGSDNINAEAGIYDVTFDRENSSYMFVTLSTVNAEFNALKVYPNPSKGNWNIQTGNADVKTLSVFTISGKLIKEMNVSQQNEIEINTANLGSGMYMIKLLTNSGNTKTLKLIKQ